MSYGKNMLKFNIEEVGEYIRSKFFINRVDVGQSTHCVKENFTNKSAEIIKVVRNFENITGSLIIQETSFWSSSRSVTMYNDNILIVIDESMRERIDTSDVKIFGDDYIVNKLMNELKSKLIINDLSKIKWIYSDDGHWIDINVMPERMPVEEFYPFLCDKPLVEYYQDFMASNANVLILIGPPGTAKTSFIRGLLQCTKSDAVVSYNQSVLEKDSVFANFLDGSERLFIMEDSDTYIQSRDSGNTMMNKFLNIADGLISDKSKKIIFTTNLPSLKDVDTALLRKGRCHDVLTFRPLDLEEALKVAKKFNLTLDETKTEFTIADIFNKDSEYSSPESVTGRIGF